MPWRALGVLAVALAFCACGNSSAPSPFVDRDAGADSSSDAPADATGDGAQGDGGPDVDPGLGGPCIDDEQCDDGIGCTFDECDEVLLRCRPTPDDSACSDGNFCNGVEICHRQLGCVAGEPISCSDDNTCTVDSCEEQTRSCEHRGRDADGDGDAVWNCGDGGDCNDTDPRVSSLAAEVCGNDRDDDCDGSQDETDCASPEHDGCVDPLIIGGSGVYTLSLAAANSDYSSSCGGSAGLWRDAVLAIAVPDGPAADVDIVASVASGVLALAAQDLCGVASSETSCAQSMSLPSGGTVSRLVLRSLPAGNHAVLVFSTAASGVTLKVSFRPPEPAPDNETCGTAAEIVPGSAVTARLAGAQADLASGCGGAAGDLVYRFELAESRDVHVYATSLDGLGNPVLSLQNGDCSAERTCNTAQNAHVFGRAMAAGVHYVSVSASGPSDISVRLELEPPSSAEPDETCEAAPPLSPNRTVPVPLSRHTDDVQIGCLTGAVDAAYALELTERSDLLLVSRLSQGDSAALALARPACADAGDRLGCSVASTSPVRLAAHDLSPGDYRVVTESTQGSPMTLTAFVRQAVAPLVVPFSDRCADAFPVPESGGFFQGNTANAASDYIAGCDLGGQGGVRAPEQMLRLVLSSEKRVVLDMKGSAYATMLVVRRGPDCPGVEVERACSAGYFQDRSFLDLNLPAGEYFLQVDGYAGDKGRWFLDIHVVDP